MSLAGAGSGAASVGITGGRRDRDRDRVGERGREMLEENETPTQERAVPGKLTVVRRRRQTSGEEGVGRRGGGRSLS
jgi:hypothetical protein